jgi:hypothetical protein
MDLEILNIYRKRTGIIKDAYDIHVEHEAGSWDVLKFSLSITSHSWSKVIPEHIIKYEDKFYRIKAPGAKRDNKGTVVQEVECPSIASDLVSKYNQVLEITGLAEVLMDAILEGTGWTRGLVEVEGGKSRTIESEWQSVITNLRDVADKFKAYLVFHEDTQTVDLIEDPGEDNGVTAQLGKNLLSLDRQIDSTDLVTRLYCYGSEDLTFSLINQGITIDTDLRDTLKSKGYTDQQIDSSVCGTNQSFIQDFSYFISIGYQLEDIYTDILDNGEASQFIRVGHLSEPDYVEPQVLLEDSKKKLDELKLPKYTYKIKLLDLAELLGMSSESLKLFDWLYVHDPELKVDVRARITKMTRYPGFPEKTEVEISNAKNNLSDVLSSTIKLGETLGSSHRISNLVKGIINTFSTIINSADGTISWSDGILEAIDNNDPNKRVRLTAGGLGVSSDGGQTYNNAITGEGILADRIIVTDNINLFSGDRRTRLTGTGLEVYDDSPVPKKIIHLGHYSSGKRGLWINTGAIEIVGTLADDNIPDISASKIVGGTLGATGSIWVGKDRNIKIDGMANLLEVYDSEETPNKRLALGRVYPDGYGLEVYNSYGDIMFSSIQDELYISSSGKFQIGSGVNYAIKYENDTLLFGSNVTLSWSKISDKPSIPNSPEDIGAMPDDVHIPTEIEITQIAEDYIQTPNLLTNIARVSRSLTLGSNYTTPADIIFSSAAGIHYEDDNLEIGAMVGVSIMDTVYFATNSTRFYGYVDFRDASVEGINAIAKFA